MYDPEKEAATKEQIERLEFVLTNQKPANDLVIMKMERIRADAKQLGISIITNTPQSREQSIALHQLEDTLMWAIKALAVNQ
jgi:hypothetical protein